MVIGEGGPTRVVVAAAALVAVVAVALQTAVAAGVAVDTAPDGREAKQARVAGRTRATLSRHLLKQRRLSSNPAT